MGLIASRSCPKEDEISSSRCPTLKYNQNEGNGGGMPGLHLGEITHLKQPVSEHIRQGSVRSRAYHPMPDTSEVDRRFAKVLASMDLPPDKAKLLKNYDDEKKWSIICDQEMVTAKDPPVHYLTKLRTYLDPKASRNHRKRKIVGESTSTQVLRDLEISLRTNHIEWVKEFLDNENQGLDALVDYLSFRLYMMRQEQKLNNEQNQMNDSSSVISQNNTDELNNSTMNNSRLGGSGVNIELNTSKTIRPRLLEIIDSPSLKRRSKHIVKLNMGTAPDDIHVCIMCLRAIMNNKYGFNMVIQHREAINNIALSIIHKSLRTKALVLELLAAICLVKGGHEIILAAFDNFKEVYHEKKRFSTLMNYFFNYEMFNIDFLVACMQFVNIVVHSVEDMNYRVHLQYEFTSLGLDVYLEKLRLTESEVLHVQISAYLDNVFDVAALMEDGETKTAALERVQELEDSLGRALDRSAEIERDYLYKLSEYESELSSLKSEREELLQLKEKHEQDIIALQNVLKENQQELKNTHNILENTKIQIMNGKNNNHISESNNNNIIKQNDLNSTTAITTNQCLDNTNSHNSVSSSLSSLSLPSQNSNNNINGTESKPIPAPPPPIAPPKPPPPQIPGGMFIPLAGHMPAPDGALTIKRKVQTKYKLPSLNWVALKPNQVRGTIFTELNDEKIYKEIDFLDFEEKFKISINGCFVKGDSELDGNPLNQSKRMKKPENVSLLDSTRSRNIAIFLKKLGVSVDQVVKSINNLDLKSLSLDKVEILLKMIPTEEEVKTFRKYVIEKKDVNMLTEENKFMLNLTKIERIAQKLYIMNYMGNFFENLNAITPQIYSIKNASNSVKSSTKFKSILEIILAFGNYLNSSKRDPAYGFKLQSLDNLLDTKSTDKKMCLLHYIASTIRQKYPDLLNFDTELFGTEEASKFSLENITIDVTELEKGMESVKKEAEVGSKGVQSHILKEFLHNSEDKLKKTQRDANNAKTAFHECVEYFGETPRNTDANAFFSLIVRFTKAFKTADQENEQRRRLAQAAALALDKKMNGTLKNNNNGLTKKQQQDAVINELKSKTTAVRDKKLLHQDEVYNGALEDILLGLKSEPYRRADALRRSHRRRIDSNRLSKNLEELQL